MRRVPRLGVFRPVVERADGPDPLVDLLRPRGADAPYEASLGATYDEVRADPERALEEIVARFRALAARCDGVLAVGTDFADVGAASRSGWRTGWSPAPPTPRRRRSGRASR